jgi:hypothetical protein
MYSLRGQREELSLYIGKNPDPMGLVREYNKTVQEVLDSPIVTPNMKKVWGPKLLVDESKVVFWSRFPPEKMTDKQIRQAIRKRTYAYTTSKGKLSPYVKQGKAGRAHKGREEYIARLRAELQKRKNNATQR